MIISEVYDNVPVISGNVGEKSGFSIKASRQSFAILSSGLYKYKIRAIIRELSCNARDAMVAAGLEQNFYVHLPTKMEPEFIVKDVGLGLSHEDVMILYTTYFESTKGNSNLFVGALGLGSKSPFCYTENFTVTSVKDGVRGVYSAFIGEDGFPSIIQLYSGETDEHNGVEVRIPVAASDFATFLQEAKSIYCWFDVKPDCNIYTTPENDLNFTETDHHTEVSGSNSIVVMGGVAYAFNLLEFVQNAPDIKFVFKLPIGSVEVLPSREGLQNTKKTKEAIIKEFERVSSNSAQSIRDTVDVMSTTYEKITYLTCYGSDYIRYLKRLVLQEKLKGQTSFVIKDMDKLNIEGVRYLQHVGQKTPKKFIDEVVSPSKTTIFIHNDNKSSTKSIRDCAPSASVAFIFSPLDKLLPVDMDAFQKNVLLGAPVLKASDFVVITKRKTVTVSRKNPLKVYVAQQKTKRHSWSPVEFKLVLLNNGALPSDFKYFVQLNAENTIDHPSITATIKNIVAIVGIRNIIFLKDKSKLDTKNLINFFDHVATEIKNLPKYYFNFSVPEYDFFHAILRHKIKFSDTIISDTITEYNKSTAADKDILKHLNSLSISDDRILYSTKIFDRLSKKYDSINFNSRDSKKIQLLIDTINNQKEKT